MKAPVRRTSTVRSRSPRTTATTSLLDFDPYSASRDDLVAACSAYDGDQVIFDLSHAGTGETETQSTGATGDGAALWTEVIGGDLTITGHDLAGYGEAIVYCSSYNPAALVFESNYAAVDVTNMRFAYELTDDYSCVAATGSPSRMETAAARSLTA